MSVAAQQAFAMIFPRALHHVAPLGLIRQRCPTIVLVPLRREERAGKSPTPIDGRSVADAILNGREPERQPVFAEIASLDAIYHGAEEPEQLAAHVMVRDEDWKYIWNRFDIDELYDLNADPGEMCNVANGSEHRNRAASMRGQIAEMICHTGPGPYEWCLPEREKNG